MNLPLLPLCAQLCLLSYEKDAHKIIDGLVGLGLVYGGSFHDQGTDTQGYICRGLTEPCMFVVFRGSQSVKDFIIDALAVPTPEFGLRRFCGGEEALVHLGFHEAWESVHEPVMAAVENFYKAEMRAQVVVTGHSLGAALATLAAAEIGRVAPALAISRLALVNFGSPRVGTPAFVHMAEDCIGAISRVVVEDDCVTTIPVAPFAHVSGLLHLTRDGRVIGPLGRGWRFIWRHLGKWLRMQWKQTRAVVSGKAFTDHHIEGYIHACRAYSEHDA